MSSRQRYAGPHAGGEQMPLFVPPSDWRPLTQLPDLRHLKIIALDTETRDDGLAHERGPGWATGEGHVCGVSAAWPGGSFYAPVKHPDTECLSNVDQWVKDHVNVGVRFVFHNAHYDVGWLRTWGLKPGAIHDTQCMAVMLDENKLSYSLDSLSKEEGVAGKDEAQLKEALAVYGYPPKGDKWKSNLWRLPARYVGPYAEADAVATLALYEKYAPRLSAEGVEAAYETEMQLVPCVHEMRWRGVRVNIDKAARAADQLKAQRDECLAELSRRLSRRVSIDDVARNRWLEEVFDQEKIPYPRTVPTSMFPNGQPSFTGGKLGWMTKHPHWLPSLVSRADGYHKAAKDFLEAFIIGAAHRGRLHASINQYLGEEDGGHGIRGTRTHRFSYSNPPLQQMPHRDEMVAPLVRGCFLPEEGERWAKVDCSQQEYRLIVHFSESFKPPLCGAREAGDRYRGNPETDFHQMMADLTGLDRKPAKDANFANAYGAGVRKFAEMTNRTVAEAQEIMDQVNRGAPFVRSLGEVAERTAQGRGWVRLIDGARLHYEAWEPTWRDREAERGYSGNRGVAPCNRPEALARAADPEHPWHGKRIRRAMTRKAGNALIQGSAARHTKRAMVACWREGIVPLLQMHDELDVSVGCERDGNRVGELMCEAVKLTVPMLADVGFGKTWGDAKHKWSEVNADEK